MKEQRFGYERKGNRQNELTTPVCVRYVLCVLGSFYFNLRIARRVSITAISSS